MSTVHISLGERSYDIHIGNNLLSHPDAITSVVKGNQVLVISNEVVAPLYLEQLARAFSDHELHHFILEDGEQTKNLENFSKVLDFMIDVPFDRRCTIVALGGGVVGDLAGFISASYQRGIPFIQVPTTLLAQVDSSVGGKTGVNHPQGKNMIGAFNQPKAVFADIDTLSTLDDRQFSAGLAEVIKYGLINDLPLFCWLEENIESVMAKNSQALVHIITRSCENKRDIVEQDEQEQGVRALLNLGHTFGHAIETATGYTRFLHGEAVSIGMVMAADLSRRLGSITDQDCQRVVALLTRSGLPTEPVSGVEPMLLRRLMQADKKVMDGTLRLVLMEAIGRSVITDNAPAELVMETLDAFTLA